MSKFLKSLYTPLIITLFATPLWAGPEDFESPVSRAVCLKMTSSLVRADTRDPEGEKKIIVPARDYMHELVINQDVEILDEANPPFPGYKKVVMTFASEEDAVAVAAWMHGKYTLAREGRRNNRAIFYLPKGELKKIFTLKDLINATRNGHAYISYEMLRVVNLVQPNPK